MFKKTFENYAKIYRNILDNFYPSLGSTGFQERNLTVNFSKAYELTNKEDQVLSWFELQFGEKKNNHFDCLIVNVTQKTLLFIESKRFTNVEAKHKEIIEDIDRIQSFVASGLDERFKAYQDFKIYGIILADVWQESLAKESIYQKYVNKELFNDISLKDKWHLYDVQRFEIDGCKDEYDLLSFIWEIK